MKKLFLILIGGIILSSCSENKNEAPQENPIIVETSTTHSNPLEQQKIQMVKLTTSYGDMVIKLYNETPQHRDNFIKLVKDGYYNDLIFHRVIKDFMIQGGDPDSKNAPAGKMLGSGGPAYTIPAEFNPAFIHKKGALAAARQGDEANPKKASSGSQFYIVQGKTWTDAELSQIELNYGMRFTDDQKKIYKEIGGTPFLDNNYTVYGEVIEGLDVIDKIAAVQKDRNDRPLVDLKIKIELIED